MSTKAAVQPRDTESGTPAEPADVVDAPPPIAKIAFWFSVLFIASCIMMVGNKAVMLEFGAYPNFLTLLQNGATVVALFAMKSAGTIEMKPFSVLQWKVFSVNAVLLAIQILSSLLALPLVAIATVVAFRNLANIAVAGLEYLIFGKKLSVSSISGLALIVVGMTLYAGSDVGFNSTGYMWLAVNSAATVANNLWNKLYITKYTRELKIQTAYGVTFIQQCETIPIVLLLAANNSEMGAVTALMELPFTTLMLVALTCAGGLLIGTAYGQCFSLASGTSVVVASTANKAFAIILGVWAFGTVLTANQVIGLLVCILGALWFAVEQKQKEPNFLYRKCCGSKDKGYAQVPTNEL